MATTSVTSLLCGLIGALVVVGASADTDLSACQVSPGSTLSMTPLLQTLSDDYLDLYVSAQTRELQPNTSSSVLSVKTIEENGDPKYEMYTTVNVYDGSGNVECKSIRHVYTYDSDNRRLVSEPDPFNMILHVYLLAYDAAKGHVVFFVELYSNGQRLDPLNVINVLTSDCANVPTLSWTSDGVHGVCPSAGDVTQNFYNELTIDTNLEANCGN